MSAGLHLPATGTNAAGIEFGILDLLAKQALRQQACKLAFADSPGTKKQKSMGQAIVRGGMAQHGYLICMADKLVPDHAVSLSVRLPESLAAPDMKENQIRHIDDHSGSGLRSHGRDFSGLLFWEQGQGGWIFSGCCATDRSAFVALPAVRPEIWAPGIRVSKFARQRHTLVPATFFLF
jgi:hypothetical protein